MAVVPVGMTNTSAGSTIIRSQKSPDDVITGTEAPTADLTIIFLATCSARTSLDARV